MEDIEELREELSGLSRSERIKLLFDFDPFPYQSKLIDKAEERDVFKAAVKPGRQVGKTVTGGAIAAERALKGHDVMILGPFEDTVKEMMEAARNHLQKAENKFSEAGFTLGTVQRNKFDWDFQHTGRLRARTVGSDGTQIRGKNPDVVLIDEDAYIKDSIHTEVIEPFFSTHDSWEFYLFSTPAGKAGYFYQKVEEDDSFYSPHWPSSICPLIDESFLEQKRKELPSQTFEQEYLGQFAEEGNSAIPHKILTPNINPDPNRDPAKGRFLGIDPARKGNDEMVAFDIDEAGVTWNIWAFETISGPEFVNFIEAVQKHGDYPKPVTGSGTVPTHGYQSILIEENGVGGFGADFAQAGLGSVIKTLKTTNERKQNMYQRLIKDLEDESLSLPNHRKLVKQTTQLQKTFTPTNKARYEHPPGKHDDWPDALAMANLARHGGGKPMSIEQTNTVPLAW